MSTQKIVLSSLSVSRRQFLLVSGILFTTAILPISIKSVLAQSLVLSDDSFYHLSQFLTDKTNLDQTVSKRTHAALIKTEADFATKAANLLNIIQENKFQSVDELKVASIFSGEIVATTITIISAWYLGYAGVGIALKAHDNTEFITYTQALMYPPVMDAEVMPTYAKWNLNFWQHPPRTIATD